MRTVTVREVAAAAGWEPGIGGHPSTLSRAVDAGLLAPKAAHPGSGRRTAWSDGDLADAKVIGAWRHVAGRDPGQDMMGVLAQVLDLWRAVGRPDGWVGTFNGAPRCWTIPAAVWVDVQSGSAVVAVRAEGP